MKPLYTELVKVVNQAAQSQGYADASQNWMNELEIDNLETVADDLYEQLKPLYEQLHAYVRRKLSKYYGADKFKSNKIPIHLLGKFDLFNLKNNPVWYRLNP
jgi:peptidyl-dipeptidase A